MNYILLVAAITTVALLAFGLRRYLGVYLKFRGQRIVSCPETHRPAAVRVAAGKAAISSTVGHDTLGLCECSRWPERQDCPLDCLAQIREAPEACLVWNIMRRWYQGQVCSYCHKAFRGIHWHDHPPAMVDGDHKTIQWNEIPADRLQETMRTHVPVCWNCHIAETFRRMHPDLVVDRPAH